MAVSFKRDRSNHQESPMLWLSVLAGSLVMHLVVLFIGRWYLSQTASAPTGGNPSEVEFVEIDPNTISGSRSVKPPEPSPPNEPPTKSPSAENPPEKSSPIQSQIAQDPPQLKNPIPETSPQIEATPQLDIPSPSPKPQLRQEKPAKPGGEVPSQQRDPVKPSTLPSSDRQIRKQPSSDIPTPSASPSPSPSSDIPTPSALPSPESPDTTTSPSQRTESSSGSSPSPDQDNLPPSTTNPDNPNGPVSSGNQLPSPDFGGSQNPKAPTSSNPIAGKAPVSSTPTPTATGFSVMFGPGKFPSGFPEQPNYPAQPTQTSSTISVTSLPARCALNSEVISNSTTQIVLRLVINESGEVEQEPEVLKSSGSSTYDAFVQCVMRDWKFEPAYNIKNNQQFKVPSNLDLPVTIQVSRN
jgi:TonB family protein